MVDEGVRRAYTDKDNPLRASVLADPDGARKNTRDNTPAVVHMEVVPGDKVEVKLAAKGGGSESKSRFAVLNPSDDVVEWILGQVPTMGGDWCPPGMLGVGIGGTPEKAMVMAKESLMAPHRHPRAQERAAPKNRAEELRLELYEKVNALGIGAQGLGGLTTVLDVKVLDYPTHAVMKPVAIIPNCAATRHIEFHLDGSGPARFDAPSLDNWPKIALDLSAGATRVDLEKLTKAETAKWKAGDRLLLTGKILTGRDAAHKRLTDLIAKGEKLPVDLKNRLIYYVGPVDAVRDEVVGPAGPTTSRRMDKFMDTMLGKTGMLGSIGKSERGAAGGGGDQAAQGRSPDRGGRRRLPGVEGHPRGAGAGVQGSRHGGGARIRGQGHAGDGRGRHHRQRGARERPARVARQDRQDPGHGGLTEGR